MSTRVTGFNSVLIRYTSHIDLLSVQSYSVFIFICCRFQKSVSKSMQSREDPCAKSLKLIDLAHSFQIYQSREDESYRALEMALVS